MKQANYVITRVCAILLVCGVSTTLASPTSEGQCPPTGDSFGACVVACSSNGDCSGDQLCCSNGCGMTCMDPINPCDLVACLAPNCSSSSLIVTPEGECCPACGCEASDGSIVAPGTSYQDDCNTCSCVSNGLAACTLMACVPATEPTPTPACPVIGQIRSQCASVCNVTCANRNTLQICPEVCILDGCECPSGTVINEANNTCVASSDCPAEACPVEGQIRRSCASPCTTTCANKDQLLACVTVCVVDGCQCPSGTVVDEATNRCVAPTDCPDTTACPISGQVRSQCASPCNTTCANRDTPIPCPRICVINGCQCPQGTVIDEATNSCVTAEDCPVITPACPVVGQVRKSCASGCRITCTSDDLTCYSLVCLPDSCECPQGMVINEDTNTCVPPSRCPTKVGTCPVVGRVDDPSRCVDDCSSNDDCEYDTICCANGCGRHTCAQSQETCQLIACGWPDCGEGIRPVSSPFHCCPGCPTCKTPNGTWVLQGTSYKDSCNTCTCESNNQAACTEIACVTTADTQDGEGGALITTASLMAVILSALLGYWSLY